ncbi:MAG: hypothetical protein FWD62_05485 [Betaproteobacteria bacterium]|nr:hypothetical protein [Betaproteobacteria bacterium]
MNNEDQYTIGVEHVCIYSTHDKRPVVDVKIEDEGVASIHAQNVFTSPEDWPELAECIRRAINLVCQE